MKALAALTRAARVVFCNPFIYINNHLNFVTNISSRNDFAESEPIHVGNRVRQIAVEQNLLNGDLAPDAPLTNVLNAVDLGLLDTPDDGSKRYEFFSKLDELIENRDVSKHDKQTLRNYKFNVQFSQLRPTVLENMSKLHEGVLVWKQRRKVDGRPMNLRGQLDALPKVGENGKRFDDCLAKASQPNKPPTLRAMVIGREIEKLGKTDKSKRFTFFQTRLGDISEAIPHQRTILLTKLLAQIPQLSTQQERTEAVSMCLRSMRKMAETNHAQTPDGESMRMQLAKVVDQLKKVDKIGKFDDLSGCYHGLKEAGYPEIAYQLLFVAAAQIGKGHIKTQGDLAVFFEYLQVERFLHPAANDYAKLVGLLSSGAVDLGKIRECKRWVSVEADSDAVRRGRVPSTDFFEKRGARMPWSLPNFLLRVAGISDEATRTACLKEMVESAKCSNIFERPYAMSPTIGAWAQRFLNNEWVLSENDLKALRQEAHGAVLEVPYRCQPLTRMPEDEGPQITMLGHKRLRSEPLKTALDDAFSGGGLEQFMAPHPQLRCCDQGGASRCVGRGVAIGGRL